MNKKDTYYEQFTLHALNEPERNTEAPELYQMLEINDSPINYRAKELDSKCFPAVYPYGENGQYCQHLLSILN